MKILEEMQPKDWKTQTYCRSCTSKLEVTLDDLYKVVRRGLHGSIGFIYLDCPVCKQYHDVDDIPSAVWELVRTQDEVTQLLKKEKSPQ